jgi:hypothetical protein
MKVKIHEGTGAQILRGFRKHLNQTISAKGRNTMNTHILAIISAALVSTAWAWAGQVERGSQAGGLPALTERVAALESMVATQSNQIALLRRALLDEVEARIRADVRVFGASSNQITRQIVREAASRQAGDVALQNQINHLPGSEFTADQITLLKSLAGVLAVTGTNVHVAGGLCVSGNLAVAGPHSLLVDYVMPSDGACSGNPAGLTIFGGNVGIMATNTLYVNQLRAFSTVPPSPQELQEAGVFLGRGVAIVAEGDNVLVEGPMLLRSR